ncbi:hypothetical protein DSO57_1019778 [Entomophthora muscae]|uniref:Uncharacterized protein n=1 Tax=Entomophthora muscae TaxID=34485 RepID=A0ACC2UDM2_9FUNG|nr:hypothetical protein DSO57_1019778 [Entomophthora muscae]
MTPPLTLQPNCLQKSIAANESTLTQILEVIYITIIGLIDSMVSTSGPWAILAPILWWALPSGPAGHLPESSQEIPTGWIPDSQRELVPKSYSAVIICHWPVNDMVQLLCS